jgi:hypothetical protein
MVSFRDLWGNHPTNTGEQYPCQHNGAATYANQCAVRMGVCLKRAGVPVEQLRGPVACGVHGREELHLLRASEVANAISGIAGVGPRYKLQNPDDFANELNGRKGIIYFANYWYRAGETVPTGDHIDLWNGWRTTAKVLLPWFSWLGGYDRASEILFWDVA